MGPLAITSLLHTPPYVCSPVGAEEAIRSSETGVTDCCMALCGCWELNPEPLEKQQPALSTEPRLWVLNVNLPHNNWGKQAGAYIGTSCFVIFLTL